MSLATRDGRQCPSCSGDLVADRDVVAGHHLDREAELAGLGDRLLGVGARRVRQRQEADQRPGLAVAELATPSAR